MKILIHGTMGLRRPYFFLKSIYKCNAIPFSLQNEPWHIEKFCSHISSRRINVN